MYSLKTEGIGKHYAGTILFKEISFSLGQGDVLGITGWNGSGKSTLLRILAGLVRPSAGRIQMFAGDKAIPKASRRKFLGLVAPAISLYEELTGIENLEFFCKVRGRHCRRSDYLEMIDQVGLNNQGDKRCGNYSSGMKQRLKLAQALIHKPALLLLDEPGTNLDGKGMKIVERIVFYQLKTGMTVIASNEKREVAYANRIINLSERSSCNLDAGPEV